jgi:sensor histidine kinase YesM
MQIKNVDIEILKRTFRQTKLAIHFIIISVILVIGFFIFQEQQNPLINYCLVSVSAIMFYFIFFLFVRGMHYVAPLFYLPVMFGIISFAVIAMHFVFSEDIIQLPVIYEDNVSVYFRLSALYLAFLTIFLAALSSHVIVADIRLAIIRQQQIKEKEKMLITSLKMQMTPHFVYNCFVNLNDIIRTGDAKKAIKYNNAISKLLRLQLENSLMDEIPLLTELDWLKSYMDVELHRYPGLFKYNIASADVADNEELFIPPMMLQPFIENSIKHGFMPAGADPQNQLSLFITVLSPTKYQIEIKDNGRKNEADKILHYGFKPKSISLENIQKRINILRQVTNFNIKLFTWITNGGFTVKLIIDYEENPKIRHWEGDGFE